MQNKPSEKQSSCEKSSERSAPKAEPKSTKHSHHSSPHGNSKNETSNKKSTECSPQTYAELNKYNYLNHVWFLSQRIYAWCLVVFLWSLIVFQGGCFFGRMARILVRLFLQVLQFRYMAVGQLIRLGKSAGYVVTIVDPILRFIQSRMLQKCTRQVLVLTTHVL